MLVNYLTTVNPSIETGVLLSKVAGGPSKKNKGSKKGVKASTSNPSLEKVEKIVPVSPKKVIKMVVTQPTVEDTNTQAKETLPSKYGVLKRLKKTAHRPRHSPDMPLVKDVKSKIILRPQLNSKGVVICEIPSPVSLASKKRRAEDMAKRISKNKKK